MAPTIEPMASSTVPFPEPVPVPPPIAVTIFIVQRPSSTNVKPDGFRFVKPVFVYGLTRFVKTIFISMSSL